MTSDGLQANGLVDLVVWPEALLNESQSIELTSPIAEADKSPKVGKAMPMLRFRRELLPKYQTNCLVGVSIRKPADIVLEGRTYAAMAKYNCGCLVSYPSGAECHEKLVLMPMPEALPKWFEWLPEVRNWLLPSRNPLELYQPGSDFRPLTFSNQTGVTRRIGVAI